MRAMPSLPRIPSLLLSALGVTCIGTVASDVLAFGGSARELERQGTFVVTNNAGFGFAQQIGHGGGTSLTLRPALDYFVIDHLSIGGAVEIDHDSSDPATTSVALAPEVGYEVALGDTWSFWPQVSVPLVFPNPGDPRLTLVFFAPFLVHPAAHFFFGIGPGLAQRVTGPATTQITGGFLIGGYFDH